jgi:tripartite-type tricarboxylate transporter receptor subunit TctC
MKLGVWLASLLTLAAIGGNASAQSVEQFYKGKTIKLYVGVLSGARDDLWARLFLKAMQQRIPGNPTIIIQNMPGARQVVADYLANVAPQDGTAFGHISNNLPVQLVAEQTPVNFDVRKFNWLGGVETVEQVCLAMATAPVKKAEDLFNTELIVAGAGAGSLPNVVPTVLNNVLNTKFKLVPGYPGQSEMYLSMERAETQGACTALSSFTDVRAEWLKEGKVNILFNTGNEPPPGMPNVPSIFKFVKTDEQREIISFVTSGALIGRPFAAAPNVPAERVKALRDALTGALQDPELLAEAKRQKMEIRYSSPEQLAKLVNAVYDTPKPLVERAAKMMSGK